MKLSKRQKELLFEAYRRNDMCDSREKQKPINRRWLGLGTAVAYKLMIESGLMTFHDSRIPPKGCMGWLVLTQYGIALLEENKKEFAIKLKELKSNPLYQGSYISQYQLAGGITK